MNLELVCLCQKQVAIKCSDIHVYGVVTKPSFVAHVSEVRRYPLIPYSRSKIEGIAVSNTTIFVYLLFVNVISPPPFCIHTDTNDYIIVVI